MLKFHQALKNAFSSFKEKDDVTTEACNGFIQVQYENVTFTMQSGDVKDFGVNGVQCEEMIAYVKSYLEILNSHVSSHYNVRAINHLNAALNELNARTQDRIKRGVEGTSND